jgi:hypothetical protein
MNTRRETYRSQFRNLNGFFSPCLRNRTTQSTVIAPNGKLTIHQLVEALRERCERRTVETPSPTDMIRERTPKERSDSTSYCECASERSEEDGSIFEFGNFSDDSEDSSEDSKEEVVKDVVHICETRLDVPSCTDTSHCPPKDEELDRLRNGAE